WTALGNVRSRVVVVGRLRPGVTHALARDEMAAIAARLAQKYPDLAADPDFPGFTANLVPLEEHVTGRDVRAAVVSLMAAALLVLLIACANVANLLVARGSSRQRELAVRTALGASRLSLIRQVLYESLLLASAAGFLGLALADPLVRVVVALAPATLPRVDSISVDGRVVIVTLMVVFASAVTFGCLSAWQMKDLNPEEALREGGRGQGVGARHRRVQRLLIAGELALTLTLLAGAGLLLRSLELVERTPLGFDPQNLLAFRVVVADGLTDAQRANFYQAAIDRIRAVPSVTAVGITSNLFATSAPDTTILPEGQSPGVSAVMVADDAVTSEFFGAMRVPPRRGRFFSTADLSVSQHVAIVNQAFARQFWPAEDPIGKRFRFGDDRFSGDPWVTVIGVVGDMRRGALEQQPFPQVFLPFGRSPSRGADLVVQAASAPSALARSVRAAVASVDPTVPVYRVSTVEERIDYAAHAAALSGQPSVVVRYHSARACRRRPLWSDAVRRGAAQPGDRRAHGVGRLAPERPVARRL
ncbi:MAG: ABC transporter permease, partial [Steroidobacteraceae bacterium]